MFSAAAAISLCVHEPLIVERPSSIFNRVAAPSFQQNLRIICEQKPLLQAELTILDDYTATDCWLGEAAVAGFAVARDRELINVFSRLSGQGFKAVEFAQSQYDHLHLNCYEGRMEDFYARAGFREMRREANWFSTDSNPLPRVVYMAWDKV